MKQLHPGKLPTSGITQQVCLSFRGRVSYLFPSTPLLLHKSAGRKLKPDPIQAAPTRAGLSCVSLSLSTFYSPPSFFFLKPQPL